jgi:hypothetical protein
MPYANSKPNSATPTKAPTSPATPSEYRDEASLAYRQLDRVGAQIWSDMAYVQGRISKDRWDQLFDELSSSHWSPAGYVDGTRTYGKR